MCRRRKMAFFLGSETCLAAKILTCSCQTDGLTIKISIYITSYGLKNEKKKVFQSVVPKTKFQDFFREKNDLSSLDAQDDTQKTTT